MRAPVLLFSLLHCGLSAVCNAQSTADFDLRIDSAVQVSFHSTLGRAYFVESSPDVEPPIWKVEGRAIEGTGQRKNLTFITTGTGKRVFRVQELKLNEGLLAFYPFNGNALDESGNGNNGTVSGAVLSTNRFGEVNEAFSFDGVNDYVSLPGSAPFASSNYTVSLWFNAAQLPATAQAAMLISKGRGNMEIHVGMGSPNVPSGIRFLPRPVSASMGQQFDATTASVRTNQWMHLVAICEREQNNARLLLDGVELPLARRTGADTPNDSMPARLGTRYDGSSPFKGTLDSVRIYDRVLTRNEIKALSEIRD